MRERHETPLNTQQIEQVRAADSRQRAMTEKQQRAVADHALRVRCVEQAIKAIDSLPDITFSRSDVSPSLATEGFNVAGIAESIYNFVNEPLLALKGDE